jgi:hypothetical protein
MELAGEGRLSERPGHATIHGGARTGAAGSGGYGSGVTCLGAMGLHLEGPNSDSDNPMPYRPQQHHGLGPTEHQRCHHARTPARARVRRIRSNALRRTRCTRSRS